MTAPMTREQIDGAERDPGAVSLETLDRLIAAARYGLDMEEEVERLTRRLWPDQGHGYANEVERQRYVIDEMARIARDVTDERDAARAAFTSLRDAVLGMCRAADIEAEDRHQGDYDPTDFAGVLSTDALRAVVEGVEQP